MGINLCSHNSGIPVPSLRLDYAYSNYTLFNQSSLWDTYLTALYGDWGLPWIYANVTNTGYLSGEEDYDFYEFYVSSPGGVNIRLWWSGSMDFDLYLFDGLTRDQLSSSAGYSNPEQINYTVTKPGWYLIVVYSYSGSGIYNLRLTSTGATIK